MSGSIRSRKSLHWEMLAALHVPNRSEISIKASAIRSRASGLLDDGARPDSKQAARSPSTCLISGISLLGGRSISHITYNLTSTSIGFSIAYIQQIEFSHTC